jgi:hypothetical protein
MASLGYSTTKPPSITMSLRSRFTEQPLEMQPSSSKRLNSFNHRPTRCKAMLVENNSIAIGSEEWQTDAKHRPLTPHKFVPPQTMTIPNGYDPVTTMNRSVTLEH